MPQDGSNNYYYPPGTRGVPDTTIESEAYNTFLDDLVINDLNAARPITRGGTGAVNAHDAMINLNGEISNQLVTNYDTHPWVNGSFASAPGATAAPESANWYSGIVYTLGGNPDYITLEAHSFGGVPWSRSKVSGVWQAWQQQPGSLADLTAAMAAGLALKVAKAGDTMTGPLTVNSTVTANPIALNATNIAYTDGTNYLLRSNAKIIFQRASDGFSWGAVDINGLVMSYGGISTPGSISASGNISSSGSISAGGISTTGSINASGTITGGIMSSGTYSGGSFTGSFVNTGPINGSTIGASSEITSQANVIAAGAFYGGGGTMTLNWPTNNRGVVWDPPGQNMILKGNSDVVIQYDGKVRVGRGICSRTGLNGTDGPVAYTLDHVSGSGFYLRADDTGLGFISTTSDYRIKKDVLDLPNTWDIVKALRPVKYTQANFGTGPAKVVADNIERWGFIAHELQETTIMSAATAQKDAPNDLQSPNHWTVIAALTKTIQEMQARIEALENG